MLGRRDGLQIPWIITLHTFHEGNTEARCEKRIFTVSLLTASPPRVAKDVDVGRPKSQTIKTLTLIVFNSVVILSAGFIGNSSRDCPDQFLIPRSTEPNRLRENCSCSCIRDSMEGFIPPVVSRNSKPVDCCRLIHHLRDLLFDRKTAH